MAARVGRRRRLIPAPGRVASWGGGCLSFGSNHGDIRDYAGSRGARGRCAGHLVATLDASPEVLVPRSRNQLIKLSLGETGLPKLGSRDTPLPHLPSPAAACCRCACWPLRHLLGLDQPADGGDGGAAGRGSSGSSGETVVVDVSGLRVGDVIVIDVGSGGVTGRGRFTSTLEACPDKGSILLDPRGHHHTSFLHARVL